MSNALLASLPASERESITEYLEPVTHRAGESLMRAADVAAFVYFPDESVATWSLAAVGEERAAEITTIGREGMVGFPQALVDAPAGADAKVRIAGSSRRMSSAQFRQQLGQLPALRTAVDQYSHALTLQLARAALCERRHSIEQRLSTLILLTHDRTGGGSMQLTHEQLGDMLGVRRAGVTEVATRLRSQSAIEYRRGRLNVNDREHLMQSACGCYAEISRQFVSNGDAARA